MISEEEALAKILEHVRPLPAREVPLGKALGAFSARDLCATLALPPFDNSSMDGYAVVADSARGGARLRLVGEQPAGLDRKLSLLPNETIRILTGAPMPAGADAVVMQEDTEVDGDRVLIKEGVEHGENVRRRGGDVTEGQRILAAGERLRPQLLALLASQGLAAIEVGGEVRAAIISTGDELAPAGAQLQPGQIYNSNSVMLESLLRAEGINDVQVTHCADEAMEIEAAFREGVKRDLMLISGGVSVGARDLVKPSLQAIGATLDLWRVALKPGKPFLFGRAHGCAIFGLPGNPVSAFVTFLLFVRPALRRMRGANAECLGLERVPAELSAEIKNPGDRPQYFRGVLRNGNFTPIGRQESHALFGLSRANALLRVNPATTISAGESVDVLIF